MKNNTLVHSKSAFGGMYTFINNQNIQCCVSPSDSLNLFPQFNTLWSSLLKNGVLKARQRKKSKLWSCGCTTPAVHLNNFPLVCQPFFYDHIQNTLHTALTWFIDSSSLPSIDDVVSHDTCMEWGLVSGKFYKWPLYKYWKPGHEDKDDEDLVSHFMHRYFDGDLTPYQIPY